jgi:putative ABC transport system permease protein
MFRALSRKGIADLRSRPLQTTLLFVIVALAAATAMMAVTVRDSASDPFESLLDEANGAHMWFFAPSGELLARLESSDLVEATAGPFDRSDGTLVDGDEAHPLLFFAVPSDPPDVGIAQVIEGRWLADDADEIVLDSGLAREAGLGIGDRIDVSTGGGPRRFEVVGIAAGLSRAPYPIWDPAAVYVTPDTLASFAPDTQLDPILGVRLVDGDSTQQLLDSFRGVGTISLIRWQEIRSSFNEDALLTIIVLSSFAVFALIAVGIVLANVVSGQVLSQHREIGLLKAVGFTPGQTALLFGGQALALGIAAVVVGVLLGLVTAPWWLRDVAAELGQSATPELPPVKLAIVAGLVIGALLLFTLVPAWHAGHVPVVRAIRGGAVHTDSRSSRLHGLAARLPLPRPVITGLKDLFGRPVRTWLTIGAMGIGAATVMFTLTVDATIDHLSAEPESVGEATYDLAVTRLTANAFELAAAGAGEAEPEGTLSEEEALAVVPQDGVAGVVRVRRFLARVEGGGGFVARAVTGNLETLRTRFVAGRWPETDDEISLGSGAASRLGLGVGDRVSLSVALESGPGRSESKTATFEVSGVHIEGANSGEIIVFAQAGLERLAGPTAFSELWLVLDGDADGALVARQIREASGGAMPVADVAAAAQADLAAAASDLRAVLFPLNVVLLLIAGVNLLTALLFTVRERRRDFALLKTIGFTPLQVAVAVSAGAVATAVAGAIVGIPLGFVVTNELVDFFGTDDGWPSGIATAPAAPWLLALAAIAVVVAVVGAWLPARIAARTEIASALRYE